MKFSFPNIRDEKYMRFDLNAEKLLKHKAKVGLNIEKKLDKEPTIPKRDKAKATIKRKVVDVDQTLATRRVIVKLNRLLERKCYTILDSLTHKLLLALKQKYEEGTLDASETELFFNLVHINARKSIVEQDYNTAASYIEIMSKIYPNDTLVLLSKVELNLNSIFNYDEALKDINTVIEKDQNSSKALYYKVNVLFKLRKSQEALTALEDSLLDFPKDYNLSLLKAKILNNLGQTVTAMEIIEEIIFAHPDLPDAYVEKGLNQLKSGNIHSAIQCFEEVVRIGSLSLDAFQYLAILYHQTNRRKDAIELYSMVLRYNPYEESCIKGSIKCLYELKEFDECLQQCHIHSIDAGSIGEFSQYYQVLCYKGLKQNEKAISILENLVSRYLHNEKYCDLLLLSYCNQSNFQKGHEVADTFLSNNPNSEVVYVTKGRIYQAEKKYDEAMSIFDSAVQRNPEFLYARKAKASLLLSQNKFTEAKDYFETFIEGKDKGDFTEIIHMSKLENLPVIEDIKDTDNMEKISEYIKSHGDKLEISNIDYDVIQEIQSKRSGDLKKNASALSEELVANGYDPEIVALIEKIGNLDPESLLDKPENNPLFKL